MSPFLLAASDSSLTSSRENIPATSQDLFEFSSIFDQSARLPGPCINKITQLQLPYEVTPPSNNLPFDNNNTLGHFFPPSCSKSKSYNSIEALPPETYQPRNHYSKRGRRFVSKSQTTDEGWSALLQKSVSSYCLTEGETCAEIEVRRELQTMFYLLHFMHTRFGRNSRPN